MKNILSSIIKKEKAKYLISKIKLIHLQRSQNLQYQYLNYISISCNYLSTYQYNL